MNAPNEPGEPQNFEPEPHPTAPLDPSTQPMDPAGTTPIPQPADHGPTAYPTGGHPGEPFATGQYPPGPNPTGQYPPGPYPTGPNPSAAAASGGGLRRHRTAILTGVAALVIGGVIGGGIGWAVGDSGNNNTTATATGRHVTSADKHSGAAAAGRRHGHGTVGSITAMDGSSWTVQTRADTTLTVTITPNTTFGTKAHPQKETDFTVGDRIAVAGTRDGDTIDATRIAKRMTERTTPQSAAPAPSAQPS